MEKNIIKKIVYNLAQLVFVLCKQPIKILEWGRGTGKSTILAKDIIDKVTQLPRSTGVMVAETYAQIKTRTLPSTIAGLEQHGIYKDLHYFVGRRPPESWNWPEPYAPPLDYKHCVIFWNGTVMLFVSQDGGAASGRGLNVDWIVGDEAARLDREKFETDVLLTNRGNKMRIANYPDGTWKYYKDCPLHHSITLATSTPITQEGMWILNFEQQAMLEPDRVAFLRASAEVNRDNLGDEYFEQAKASMPDFLYQAEVENKRMTKIEDGFYPLLEEKKHCYNLYNNDYYINLQNNSKPTCLGDGDLNLDAPLICGIDWGGNINCMVVCQDHGSEFRFLNNLFVKHPRVIDHLIEEEFVPYYKDHRKKVMYLWYDPTGNHKVANSRYTFAEQVKKLLETFGWQVQLMTKWGANESHENKYRLWLDLLKGVNPKYPHIKINKYNCKELWISMTTAPAEQKGKELIRKNKSSEKKKGMLQEHATHFSDAADVVVVGMFLHVLMQPQRIPETRTM